MSTQDNIIVKDDAATPVSTTLIPVSSSDTSAEWRGNNPLIPLIGQIRLSVLVEKVKVGHRVVMKTEVPVMETLGASGTSAGYVAPPKVAYVITVITTMFVDPRSTATDRANALKIHECAVQGASATAGTGLTGIAAAGGAFLASVLPGPLLYTGLVVPS